VFWKRKHVVDEFRHETELLTEEKKEALVLKNILPEKVIQEIKEKGSSSAETYPSVTVLHSDIVNFTKTTASFDPEFVISELNEIFTAFDEIAEKHNCMRVKTIGDAYVAVCGLPEQNSLHAENMVQCAEEYISYLEKKNKTAAVQWNVRVGLASGPVVAGVVGVRKYVYDIFGATVDKALRMEESCEAMCVMLSKETYALVKDKYPLGVDSDFLKVEKDD
jgi:class 3 adenylate cyclase